MLPSVHLPMWSRIKPMKKTALITGASGGIGSATARRLAKDGFAVVISCCSNTEAAQALADELILCGADVLVCPCDVSDEKQVNKMFADATEKFGGVSVLVNNAGISSVGLFTDMSEAEFSRIVSVNLCGAANCCRAAVPYMVREKYGRIINISSMWGVSGASCEVAYSASKAGMIGLTKSLARELAPSGVLVNCIAPGVIDTKMNAHLSDEEMKELCNEIPLGRQGSPEEVAALVSFLAGEDSSYITAQVIGIDGGFIV